MMAFDVLFSYHHDLHQNQKPDRQFAAEIRPTEVRISQLSLARRSADSSFWLKSSAAWKSSLTELLEELRTLLCLHWIHCSPTTSCNMHNAACSWSTELTSHEINLWITTSGPVSSLINNILQPLFWGNSLRAMFVKNKGLWTERLVVLSAVLYILLPL